MPAGAWVSPDSLGETASIAQTRGAEAAAIGGALDGIESAEWCPQESRSCGGMA